MTLNRYIILKGVPVEPSLILVGNEFDYYCDKPIDKLGGMRLATYKNFAYHMMNTVEPWMIDVQRENEINNKSGLKARMPQEKLYFNMSINSDWKYKQLKRLYEKLFDVFIKKKRV